MSTEKLAMEPEEIMELGKFWEASYKANMTVEERLEGLSPEERLEGLSSEERLEGLDAQTVANHFPTEDLLKQLAPEQIEAYLQKLKQSKSV